MARISTYSSDTNVMSQDKWIGTDSNGSVTKNFTAQSIADFLNNTSAVAIAGQNNFFFQTDLSNGRAQGTISFTSGGGSNTAFASLTTIKVSKYANSGYVVLNYLQTLVNQAVFVAQTDNVNNFGIYKLLTLEQDTLEPEFYNATFQLIQSHGALLQNHFYTFSVYPGFISYPFTVPTPTLQSVTTEGNTTTNSIIIVNGSQKIELNSNPYDSGILFYNTDIDPSSPISGMSTTYFQLYNALNLTEGNFNLFANSGQPIDMYPGAIQMTGTSGGLQIVPNQIRFYGLGANNVININPDFTTTGITNLRLRNLGTSNQTIAYLSDIPSLSGYVPTARTLTINGVAYDLSANRSWTIPTGTGDMTKAVYDTNNDGAVDKAQSMVTKGRNATGSTLYKGTVIYISGATGQLPNFVKAMANVESTSAGTYGVILSDISDNSDGYAVTIGLMDPIDTRTNAAHPITDVTLAVGDTLYLHPTIAGYVTNVKPYAPNHLVYIGKVINIGPDTPNGGAIVLRIQNGYELDELHNVSAQSPNNYDGIFYNTSTNLWEKKNVSQVLPERRNANNSTNNNINYCGTADKGSAESSAVWTIDRLTIGTSGSVTIEIATNVAWTNRESAIYI